jgi:small-conductance mechanosensitive channel
LTLFFSWALIRSLVYVLQVSFSPSGALARFERWLAITVWLLVALHLLGVLPTVVESLESVGFRVGKQTLNLWMLLQGLVTVVVSLLVSLWVSGLIEARLMGTAEIDANLRLVLSRVAKTILVALAVMLALPMVGIDLTTLSLFGGALGVGLGLGLQKIAANYVSGFIILLDHSIRIGNLISVGNDRGVVTKITTRYSVLRTLSGIEIIVPNEMLMGSVVQNETFSDTKIRLGVQLQVDYRTDIDSALRVMEAAAADHPRSLKDPAPTGYLTSFSDSGIQLEVGLWINDPQEGTLNIRSDISREILRRFRAEGIQTAFPQREVKIVS